MLHRTPESLRLTLRALARLVGYPDAALRAQIPGLLDALRLEQALPAARLREIKALGDHLCRLPAFEAEARYVDTFDRGRRSSLHLFEHVHGDSRERGPALIDLAQTYERAGLRFDAPELPDHLAVVLEFASTQPPALAQAFLGEMAHILKALFSALLERASPYACVVAAVLEVAGQPVQAVPVPPEPGLDDSWAEPAAFGGCSTQGQARPGAPQPLHFVRHAGARPDQGASA